VEVAVETAAMVTTNNENGLKNDENGGKRYRKRQMIGTDDDGGVSGDDCTEAAASAECSDMRGKLYLSGLFFTTTQYGVFILCYEYPTSPFSLCIYKGNERMGIRK
jgi:hypothetical protein